MFAYRLHSRLDLKATKHDGDVAYRLAFKKKDSFIHSFIHSKVFYLKNVWLHHYIIWTILKDILSTS